MKEYEYRKEVYELRQKVKDLENKNYNLENTLNQILQSKGWKFLEKAKKVKNKCFTIKGVLPTSTVNPSKSFSYDYKTEPSYVSHYQDNIDFSDLPVYIKTLAFYLPQFHCIPENDEWWGKGFTEWTNTKKSKPSFDGHYIPRIPHKDIGYYDLSNVSVLKKQVALAKQHKIYGFIYYYYWFSGKRLLENPLDLLLEHQEIDFPFVLCWANENWTRTWDGLEKEVLMEQKYLPNDPENFIKDLQKYVSDSRYIRINNHPLILVYNPDAIPNFSSVCRKWRETAKKIGIGEIVIWSKTEIGNPSYKNTEFVDGEFDFAPHGFYLPNDKITGISNASSVVNYSKLVHNLWETYINHYPLKPFSYSVTMGWDNSARRKENFKIYYHYSLESFYLWTTMAVKKMNFNSFSDVFLLVNAWNEWGEGTYLEPDEKYGYANINTLSRAICKIPFQANFKVFHSEHSLKDIQPKIAIQAHVFYEDLFEDLLKQLMVIPYSYDLYVSTDTEQKKSKLIDMLNKFSFQNYSVEVFPNKGRDIYPMLIQMKERIDQYEYLLHIHTKKTITQDYGDEWRNYLWHNLLGSSANVKNIFFEFGTHRQIGIIYPIIYYKVFDQLVNPYGSVGKSNQKNLELLCSRLHISKDKLQPNMTFPVSSMFWARTDAIRELFSINDLLDFANECGQVDGTMAHAVERIFDLLAEKNGYETLEILNQLKQGEL